MQYPASNDEKYYYWWKIDMSDIKLLDQLNIYQKQFYQIKWYFYWSKTSCIYTGLAGQGLSFTKHLKFYLFFTFDDKSSWSLLHLYNLVCKLHKKS